MNNHPFTCILGLLLLLTGGCAPVHQALFDAGLRAERRAGDLRPGLVATSLGEIAYLERSGEGETVVLLHGFAGNKDHWTRFVPYLPDSFHVVALDMPGHGDSTFDSTLAYDVPTLVRGITEAVAGLGLNRFHLAGNSLGGLVATRLALAAPERVRTLLLLDPAGVVSPEPSAFREALADGSNPLVPTTIEAYDRLTDFAFTDPPDLPWPAQRVMARAYVARAPQNQKLWRDINTPPDLVTSDLPRLTLPTLLIFGADDRIIHPSSATVWCERVPDLTFVMLPGVGHAPMLEVPRTTARFYVDFLKRTQLSRR